MPSSSKTSHLKLNHWQGTDKPKRDDFNADNSLLDTAYGAMATDIAALDTAQQNLKSATNASLTGLGTGCDTLNSDLIAHKSNAVSHITSDERSSWNNLIANADSGAMVMGTYTGTGAATLKITMGFQPKCGFLFAVNCGIVECYTSVSQTYIYSAFFGSQGCSRNVTVENDGITVTHSTTVPSNGNAFYYNSSGKTYVYVAWKP